MYVLSSIISYTFISFLNVLNTNNTKTSTYENRNFFCNNCGYFEYKNLMYCHSSELKIMSMTHFV